MAKFVKITRINRNGIERELVVNVDTINEITEIASEEVPSKYDCDTGEVVETKEVKRYVVGFGSNDKTYEITQESAEILMGEVLK